jgi:peptide/nickel transport system ATP-binding protein
MNGNSMALSVRDLAIGFASATGGRLEPVLGVDLEVARGEVVALVGESGSGKSLTALACLGLLPAGATARGSVRVDDTEINGAAPAALERLRGRRIAMIFQNPMSALNPFFTIAEQIDAVIAAHFPSTAAARRERRARALDQVQLAHGLAQRYPHQLSGGQLQRAMIAMAMCCEPAVLVADEPTTALDVTVQARVMAVLLKLVDAGTGLLLITHDLALVAQTSQRVHVMYAGRIVESGSTVDVFKQPAHPYTAGLLATQPRMGVPPARLPVIPGQVPALAERLGGCMFRARCSRAEADCALRAPLPLERPVHRTLACHHPVPGQTGLTALQEQNHA